MSELLPLEEAQARLLELAPAMPVVASEPGKAYGRYLAEDLSAKRTQPASDLSAMDGYAVCGEGPWERVGESRAGTPFAGALVAGQCIRISTGAHMPEGADRVLIQENANVEGDSVTVAAGERDPEPGTHVRRKGFDFAAGDALLTKGTRLGPGQLALATAAGHDTLPCYQSPAIAVLDSGDELAARAGDCGPNQIPASNGVMLAAMLRPLVGEVQRIGPVRDDLGELATALAGFDGDILVTSGGASVGDHDLIQEALREWGAEIAFWRVAIKPGKPLMVATRQSDERRQVILGLPGNPVSSFVTAYLFALPLVRAAQGDPSPLPRREWRIAADDLPAVGARREFVRGTTTDGKVRRAGSQDSSALAALAHADCLIDRPSGAPELRAGERVPVYNLQNG